MGLFSSKEFTSLEGLFVDQLQDLYDAEQRLTKALPKMAEAAHNPSLKAAFQQHHLVTALGQVQRGGAAGDSATDDTDIGVDVAMQRGMLGCWMGRRGVPGIDVRDGHGSVGRQVPRVIERRNIGIEFLHFTATCLRVQPRKPFAEIVLDERAAFKCSERLGEGQWHGRCRVTISVARQHRTRIESLRQAKMHAG